jgi:hypothetical protein
MLISKYQWSQLYNEQIGRNIGLVSISEQEKIRTTWVAVLGTGGLGGSLAEQLVRSGCERIVICDNETFDKSNLNRQLCTLEDLGEHKVDVLEKFLLKINPNLNIRKFYEVSTRNISEMLDMVSITCLTLDDPIASILIARECRSRKIPILETWGIPYLFAWWFTSDSIEYEQCYGFDTIRLSIEQLIQLKKEEWTSNLPFVKQLFELPGLKSTYNREPGMIEKMLSGKIPTRSIAPIIRLNASYLAVNVIYAGILNSKKKILAPNLIGYDYFRDKPINVVLA